MFSAALTSTTQLFAEPAMQGLVIMAVGLLVFVVGMRMQPGEAGHLSSVIWPAASVATVPAVLMLIQVMPLGIVGLANPIWDSAAIALGRPLGGTISVDSGETLIALARYISAVGVLFAAAAVAVDRHRAEKLLFALVAVTTLVALMLLVIEFGSIALPNGLTWELTKVEMTDCAGLGIILAAGGAFHILDREKLKLTGRNKPPPRVPLAFIASLLSVAICCLALFLNATGSTFFAVICGALALVTAIITRRFQYGPWGYAAVASTVIVIAIAVLILQPGDVATDLTLAYASPPRASLISVTQRILAATGWVGTGAGTFDSILPIYRDIDELAVGSIAPTAAAAIAVEMGRPLLFVMLIGIIVLAFALLRGAIRRGRRSSIR